MTKVGYAGAGLELSSKDTKLVIKIASGIVLLIIAYTIYQIYQAQKFVGGVAEGVSNFVNDITTKPPMPRLQPINIPTSTLSPSQLSTFQTITADNKGVASIPEVLAQAEALTLQLSQEQGGASVALNVINGVPTLETFKQPDIVKAVPLIQFGALAVTKPCPEGYTQAVFGGDCYKTTDLLTAETLSLKSWFGW